MAIEGFVMLQHRGRYAIFNRDGIYRELKTGDRIEVDTGKDWIEMQVNHDFEAEISFYPKMVYARLIAQ